MNDFEKLIRAGIESAQKSCVRIAQCWLWDVPESFFQHELARKIGLKMRGRVYTEISRRKIANDPNLAGVPKFKPDKHLDNKRFDLVVWRRDMKGIRAIIEIKRTNRLRAVRGDAEKVKKYMTRTAMSEI